jgi:hypothetical protein
VLDRDQQLSQSPLGIGPGAEASLQPLPALAVAASGKVDGVRPRLAPALAALEDPAAHRQRVPRQE